MTDLDLLRQLFYTRLGVGDRVDDEIAKRDQELWSLVHARLNPEAATEPVPEPGNYAEMAAQMRVIAAAVKERLPEGWAFFLLTAPIGEAQGRANYISTMDRVSAINAMSEWMLNAAEKRNFNKHLP
jgi:hypothetical protein